jgi:hypothetical protein
MFDGMDKFRRYRREFSRLHDPEALGEVGELTPVNVKIKAHPHLRVVKGGGGAEHDASAPKIRVEPQSLNLCLKLFQEQHFQLSAPESDSAALIWMSRDGAAPQRVAMDRLSDGSFRATADIDDGEYIFGYLIRGVMRPDPGSARSLVLRNDGVFSKLRLARLARTLVLYNDGRKDEIVRIDSDSPWLVAGGEVKVAPGKSATVRVQLLLAEMSSGLNRSVLHTSAIRGEELIPAALVQVAANVEADGALAELSHSPADFGEVRRGLDHLRLNVDVVAHGRGPLIGMITLSQPHQEVDFQLVAGGAEGRFSHTFLIDSARLPRRRHGQVKLTLVTDSHLMNRRVFAVTIPYTLTYLKKNLPALTFGSVPRGLTRNLRLEVSRSDGEETDVEVAIPPGLAPYVECFDVRSGIFAFRFDTQGIAAGTKVTGVIILEDRRSGLRDEIEAWGEVVESDVQAWATSDTADRT